PDSSPGAAQLPKQQVQSSRPRPASGKPGRRLHREDHAGEAPVKLVNIDPPPAKGRVIDVRKLALDPFQNDEMVEIPMDDTGRRRRPERGELLPKSLRGKPQSFRCPDDIARLAAVAGYAAFNPKLLKRHPRAVIRQHHAETGGATFRRFHLQNRRRSSDALASEAPIHASSLPSYILLPRITHLSL